MSARELHPVVAFTGLALTIGVVAGLLAPILAPALTNPPVNSREDCERVYERPCRIKWEPTP